MTATVVIAVTILPTVFLSKSARKAVVEAVSETEKTPAVKTTGQDA